MRKLTGLLLFLTFITPSFAAEFDIYQSGYRPLQLGLMIEGQGYKKDLELVNGVVADDLESSQSFKVIDPLAYLATFNESWEKVEYSDWRILGADILALCKLQKKGGGVLSVLGVE